MRCIYVTITKKRRLSAQPKLQTASHHQRHCESTLDRGDVKLVHAKR
jgi:hypothetical protein